MKLRKKSLAVVVSTLLIGGTANACSFVFWDGFESNGGTGSNLCPVLSSATKINDTGITLCGTAVHVSNTEDCSTAVADASGAQVPLGQDGHYGTGKNGSKGMSFTKINGGDCVLDNHTGLLWEVKQGLDGLVGSDGLHDADDTYTWYSDTNNHGNAGTKHRLQHNNICYGYDSNNEDSFCNTQAYIARVNAEGWCGYHDWRLPTREELRSIVDYSRSSPAINTAYFPQTRRIYWSSSPKVNPYGVWLVDFSYGVERSSVRRIPRLARLVRGGQ